MRWGLYRFVRGGWYLLNTYETEAQAWADAAPWIALGVRFQVVIIRA